jgi:outer membrane receptor protein involved in Fe transport
VYQSDPLFSNNFIYTENVNAAYVNYESKFDRFNLTTAVRAEQTIAKGNSVTSGQMVTNNYLDFFPHVLLNYKYDDKKDFSISYNRAIRRPDYELINPFLYYVDKYDYRSGNPYLKPQYSDDIELTFNYNKAYSIILYSNIVSNAYTFPVYEQNDASKVNITTRKNLGTVYNYGLKFLAQPVFTNWWNANFYADAGYQRYVAYPVNGNLNKGAPDIILVSTQNFIVSNTVSVYILGKYESPNFYGVNQFKANYGVDAGVGKQLFNNRGSLKLTATDIFNTLRDRNRTIYQNLDLTTVNKVESQIVRLTFTYRFGKAGVKAPTAHNTGNEEEQKRTKTSN